MLILIIDIQHFQIFKFLNFQIFQVNKISNYFKESYIELTENVTWPTWIQLQQSTIIVLVATILITAMVFVMDFSSNQLLKLIYKLF
jgi:preprotein translocase subunit SecE